MDTLDLRFSQMALFQAEADAEFGAPLLIRYEPQQESAVLALFADARLESAAQAFLYSRGHDPLQFLKVRLKFDANYTIRTKGGETLQRIEGPGSADDDAWCALRYATDKTWMTYYAHVEFITPTVAELTIRRFGSKDDLHVFANNVEAARRRRRSSTLRFT